MEVTLNKLPENLTEFQAIPQMNYLYEPENTCTMFICALNLFIKNKDDGIRAMNILRGPRPMVPYDIQFLYDRLRDKKYLPLAYFNGASPANNYNPVVPYTLEVLPDPTSHDIEEGYLRVFLKTEGADSPRPIKLRCKDDTWFLWEYSSILSGIRIPAEDDPWS